MVVRLLSVDSVSKHFGKIEALKSITFRFDSGVLGLIGPNGCGKTTLIRIIIGNLRPDQGHCTVLGYDSWRDSRPIRNKIGVLHEKPSYPKRVSCGRYLRFVGDLYGVKNPAVRACELLERVGLPSEEVADRPIGELSAGMLQRLGICQALMNDHVRFVLLDEPTSSLDVTGRLELLSLIRELNKSMKINFLISSHILSEVERVCDKVVIVYEGRVLAKGSTRALASRYMTNEYIVSPATPDVERRLREMDGIEKLEVEANRIRITTSYNADDGIDRLQRLLPTSVLVQRASSLEDVFAKITRNERKGGDR